jgi:hypothetical protein
MVRAAGERPGDIDAAACTSRWRLNDTTARGQEGAYFFICRTPISILG